VATGFFCRLDDQITEGISLGGLKDGFAEEWTVKRGDPDLPLVDLNGEGDTGVRASTSYCESA
jgi:hypothetical protein